MFKLKNISLISLLFMVSLFLTSCKNSSIDGLATPDIGTSTGSGGTCASSCGCSVACGVADLKTDFVADGTHNIGPCFNPHAIYSMTITNSGTGTAQLGTVSAVDLLTTAPANDYSGNFTGTCTSGLLLPAGSSCTILSVPLSNACLTTNGESGAFTLQYTDGTGTKSVNDNGDSNTLQWGCAGC